MFDVNPAALAAAGAPIFPAIDGIAAWSRPGVEAVRSLRNLVEGGAASTLVGSPAYGPRWIDLKSYTAPAAYLRAPVNPATLTEWTFFAIVRPLDASPIGTASPQYISALHSASGAMRGIGLGGGGGSTSNGSLVRGTYCGITPDSAGASVPLFVQTPWPADPTAIRAVAYRGKNGDRMRVDDLFEGVYAEALDVRTGVTASELTTTYIGSSGAGTGAYGQSRIFAALILPRYVSDDELALIAWTEQRSLAADSIAVLLKI